MKFEKWIVKNKWGELVPSPQFEPEKIIFYKIDRKFKGKLEPDEMWEFETTSREIDIHKTDCYGTPMFIQYVMPIRRIYSYWYNPETDSLVQKSGDKTIGTRKIIRKLKGYKIVFRSISGPRLYKHIQMINPFTNEEYREQNELFENPTEKDVPIEIWQKYQEFDKIWEQKMEKFAEQYRKETGKVLKTIENYWDGKVDFEKLHQDFEIPPVVEYQNADELLHGWFTKNNIVVECEDTVELLNRNGEDIIDKEAELLFEWAKLYRIAKIFYAHMRMQPAPISNTKEFLKSAGRFIALVAEDAGLGKAEIKDRDEYEKLQVILQICRKVLFASGKDNDPEKGKLINKIIFGCLPFFDDMEGEEVYFPIKEEN